MRYNVLGHKNNNEVNIRLDKIRAFDYVKDLHGNLYVVRGVTKEANNIIVKPIYLSKNKELIKYDRKLGHIKLTIPRRCEWADYDSYIMTHDDIHSIFQRNKLLLKECHCGSKLLNEVENIISHHNANCYVFGSKRLQIHKDTSDLDILVIGKSNPSLIIKSLLSELHGRIRSFNRIECQQRAIRYGYPYGYINPAFLGKIFPKTTVYFKTKSSEIGLFFASDEDSIIPNIDNDYFFSTDYCEGTILASGGSSYLMPRHFSIECRKGKIKNIITPIWELGGIEECFDFKVSIEGLHKISEDIFWLGGSNISLKMLNE